MKDTFIRRLRALTVGVVHWQQPACAEALNQFELDFYLSLLRTPFISTRLAGIYLQNYVYYLVVHILNTYVY